MATWRLAGRKRLVASAVLALCAVTAGSQQASSIEMTPELKKIVDGARAEGALTIITRDKRYGGAEGVKAGIAWMKRNFGLDIKGRWAPGPNIQQQASQLNTERLANRPASSDVLFATPVQIVPFLNQGLFRQVAWDRMLPNRITPNLIEAEGRALRNVTLLSGLIYNKKQVPDIIETRTMGDLLQPKWRRKFATTPQLAGFDVLLLDEVWGVDKTSAYVKEFAKQIVGLLDCSRPERIASGEFPALVLDCGGTEPLIDRFKNVLGLHMLADVAHRRHSYVTVPTNAPNPNAGILYTLFMSTPEGQAVLWEGGQSLDIYPESKIRPVIESYEAKGYKFIDVTVDWWTRQKDVSMVHRELTKMLR